jgi:hypothetical protein
MMSRMMHVRMKTSHFSFLSIYLYGTSLSEHSGPGRWPRPSVFGPCFGASHGAVEASAAPTGERDHPPCSFRKHKVMRAFRSAAACVILADVCAARTVW